jgi:predicted phage-related endonuclease
VSRIVEIGMNELHEIKREIEVLSEQRSELWNRLSQGYDASVSTELKDIDARLNRLWDEHRALKARLRFGDRDQIIKRARTEERLLRAA